MWIRFLKIAFFVLISVAYHYTSFAAQTPAQRTCRILGGQAWVLNVGNPDDFELCRFGFAAIGSLDLLYKVTEGRETQAVGAYYNKILSFRAMSPEEYCQASGGDYGTLRDSNGRPFELCRFADGSGIEANTLQGGASSPQNAALTRALSSSLN